MIQLIIMALRLLKLPFKVFSLFTPRMGCLILALLVALLFISCGMLGRLTLVI